MSAVLGRPENNQLSAADYYRPLTHEGPIPELDPADAAAFAGQMAKLGYEALVGVLWDDPRQLSASSLAAKADFVPSSLFPKDRVAGPHVSLDSKSGELRVRSGAMIYQREITPAAGE